MWLHLIRQPLTWNKTVKNFQEKIGGNESILRFWWQFPCPDHPWHNDQTQCQVNCIQRQHLGRILYNRVWEIWWWSKKIIKYHITKNVSISTLNGVVYLGTDSYSYSNSWRYIFEWEPTKTTTKYHTALHNPPGSPWCLYFSTIITACFNFG